MLNKDSILKATDLKFRDVDVPEWGGTVRVREMDARTFEEMERMDFTKQEKPRATILVNCIVDENNECLFTHDDIDALAKKKYKTLVYPELRG